MPRGSEFPESTTLSDTDIVVLAQAGSGNTHITGQSLRREVKRLTSESELGIPAVGEVVQWLEYGKLWKKNQYGHIICDEMGYVEDDFATTITKPDGGQLIIGASTTNAIKFNLPVGFNGSKVAFTMLLGKFGAVHITGFLSGGQWQNESAVLLSGESDVRVRFGHDGTNCCVVVGTEGAESWSNEVFSVYDVIIHEADFGNRVWWTWPDAESISTVSGIAFTGDITTAQHAHANSAHAPIDAQKNSDITIAEIESVLVGEISSHTHASDPSKLDATHTDVHAPSDAQKNSDITKAEIEAKLTGEISSHSHAATRIIDGQFNHWDAGAGPFTGSEYDNGPTMWRLQNVSVTAPTSERQSFSVGQTDVPDNPTYYWNVANGGLSDTAGVQAVRQYMPNVPQTSGATIQIGVWLKGSVAGNVGFRVQQFFGTGGSPSATVTYASDIAVTTDWAFYSWEQTLDSVSGKTLGTNNDSTLRFTLDINLGSNYSFGYTNQPDFVGTLSIANFSDSTDPNKPFPDADDERKAIDKAGYHRYNSRIQLHPLDAGTPDTNRRYTLTHRFPLPDYANATITFGTVNGGSGATAMWESDTNMTISATATLDTTSTSIESLIIDNRP